MDQDETCMETGLGIGRIVLDGDPAPMSVVAKQSPIPATAELVTFNPHLQLSGINCCNCFRDTFK